MTVPITQKPWIKTHRYYPFRYFLRELYPFKVHKISLHAGFTCPNRDGLAGSGGCTYCDNESFSPNVKKEALTITEQVENGVQFLKRRYGAEKFIAYFQSFTNTYADVKTLKTRYDEALLHKDIIGISIGTRPDCITDDALNLIDSYTEKYHVWIEYGLQSIHDRTLQLVNRGHSYKEFEDAIGRTKQKSNIKICAHVILGLPGEDWEDMMETAEALSTLDIDGLKLHHLYVARNTSMANDFFTGNIKTMNMEEYVSTACDFLERIPPGVVIQRLVGDTHGGTLLSPLWHVSKNEVLSAITDELRRRNTYQGIRCIPCSAK
ncbi:MAG: TIGR01212 family radical SAM protein [Candidatus Scalindua sp.]|nr:TIGR01212 family radical SAM protein [Candidatus Scalindua sp.]